AVETAPEDGWHVTRAVQRGISHLAAGVDQRAVDDAVGGELVHQSRDLAVDVAVELRQQGPGAGRAVPGRIAVRTHGRAVVGMRHAAVVVGREAERVPVVRKVAEVQRREPGDVTGERERDEVYVRVGDG